MKASTTTDKESTSCMTACAGCIRDISGADAEKHLNDPMVIAKLQEVVC